MSVESSMPRSYANRTRTRNLHCHDIFLYNRLLKRKKCVNPWYRISLAVSSTPLFLNKNYLIVIVYLRSNFNIFRQDYLIRNIIKQTPSFFFFWSVRRVTQISFSLLFSLFIILEPMQNHDRARNV